MGGFFGTLPGIMHDLTISGRNWMVRMPTLSTDHLTKLHISHALGTRTTRVAVLIAEMFWTARELLEQQPSAVTSALCDYWTELNRHEVHPEKRKLRADVLRYCQHCRREAEKRERKLYHGLTGEDDASD